MYTELEWRAGLPTTMDVIIGWILVIVVLEASRQAYGLVLPIISSIGIVLMFFSRYIPGVWKGPVLSPDEIVSFLSIGFRGVFGQLLALSSTYIVLFVLFGGLLAGLGGGHFFAGLGKLVARRLAGGPALLSVVSSTLVGMITGAPAANVAITGVFTIPAMKRAGLKPELAGAFEACAATGSPMMPPVMGGVAFLMAGMLGIPYVTVCAMAIIPILLYYFTLALSAQFVAKKMNLTSGGEEVDIRLLLLTAPRFILPLGVIIALLMMGYTAMFAAFWATMSLFAVSAVQRFLIKDGEARPSFSGLVQGIVDGARGGSQIAVACASIGILVVSFTATGLALRLPNLVELLSAGNVAVAIILVWIVSILLGTGVPGLAVYVIVVITLVPGLVALGVDRVSAHLLSFWCSIFAAITPPVAMASLVAAKIANASYMKTAIEATKLGSACMLMPFLVLSAPYLTLRPMEGGVLYLAATLLGLIVWPAALQGYYLTRLNWRERAACAITAAVLFSFVFSHWYLLLYAGAALFVVVTTWQLAKRRGIAYAPGGVPG